MADALAAAHSALRQPMTCIGMYALVAELVAFCIISIRCGWVCITSFPQHSSLQRASVSRRQLNLRVGYVIAQSLEETAGEGAGARRSLQGMLSIACFTRAALIAVVLMREAWMPYLAVPDIAYLATYGVVCLFLARQVQVAAGNRYNHGSPFKLVVAGGLVVVLAVSLVVCTVRWGSGPQSKKSLMLRKWLYYELGITYLLLFIAFTYSGTRICITSWGLSKHAFYRMLLLTIVCGLALASKGSLFIAAAFNNWRTDALFPSVRGRYGFEAVLALEELLPSLAMLILTEKTKIGSSSHSGSRPPQPLEAESSRIGSDSSSFMTSPSFGTSIPVSPGPQMGPFRPNYGSVLTAAYNPA